MPRGVYQRKIRVPGDDGVVSEDAQTGELSIAKAPPIQADAIPKTVEPETPSLGRALPGEEQFVRKNIGGASRIVMKYDEAVAYYAEHRDLPDGAVKVLTERGWFINEKKLAPETVAR